MVSHPQNIKNMMYGHLTIVIGSRKIGFAHFKEIVFFVNL